MEYAADIAASIALIVAGLHYDSLAAKIVGYTLLAVTVLTPNISSLIALVSNRPTHRQ